MCSSAIRSSSVMATPGCRWSPTRWIVSWTSSPAFAIRSISRGLLRMITGELQGVLNLGPDRVDRLVAVDRDQIAARRVVVDDGARQLVVQRQPVCDRLGRVVGAPLVLGAPPHALHDDLARHAQLEHDVE